MFFLIFQCHPCEGRDLYSQCLQFGTRAYTSFVLKIDRSGVMDPDLRRDDIVFPFKNNDNKILLSMIGVGYKILAVKSQND